MRGVGVGADGTRGEVGEAEEQVAGAASVFALFFAQGLRLKVGGGFASREIAGGLGVVFEHGAEGVDGAREMVHGREADAERAGELGGGDLGEAFFACEIQS